MSNEPEHELERLLEAAARPVDPSPDAWSTIEERRAALPAAPRRSAPPMLAAAAVLLVLVLLSGVLLAARRSDDGGDVRVGGTVPEVLPPARVFPWNTGSTAFFDDAGSGVIAVDLDTGAALRKELPHKVAGTERDRLFASGDRLVYRGGSHIYSIAADLTGEPRDLGEATFALSSGSGVWRFTTATETGTFDGTLIDAATGASLGPLPYITIGGDPRDSLVAAVNGRVLVGQATGVDGNGGSVPAPPAVVGGPGSFICEVLPEPSPTAAPASILAVQPCTQFMLVDRNDQQGSVVVLKVTSAPIWVAGSPDGSRIVISRRDDAAGGSPELVVYAQDGTRLASYPVAMPGALYWTPDGSTVLSSSVQDVRGHDQVQVAAFDVADRVPGIETSVATLPIAPATWAMAIVDRAKGPNLSQPSLPPCPPLAAAAAAGTAPNVTEQPCRLQVNDRVTPPGTTPSTAVVGTTQVPTTTEAPTTSSPSTTSSSSTSTSPSSTAVVTITLPPNSTTTRLPRQTPPGTKTLPVNFTLVGDPDPNVTTVQVVTHYAGCAGFEVPGDRLYDPVVVEEGNSVTVTFRADPYPGSDADAHTCPLPAGTPYTIRLQAPLGTRTLYDGTSTPPAQVWPSPTPR